MALKFIQIADDLVSITITASRYRTFLAQQIRTQSGIEEVVEGITSLVVKYNPLKLNTDEVQAQINQCAQNQDNTENLVSETIIIPIEYNEAVGPDLMSVCDTLDLDIDEFILRHTSQTHKVDLIGFTPGFAYIGGTDFNLPRLKEPRIKVPAGSVGLAGGYTGIYALEGPGGWPIIGRTLKPLFEPDKANPFVLSPHVNIKFEAITK